LFEKILISKRTCPLRLSSQHPEQAIIYTTESVRDLSVQKTAGDMNC